LGGARIGVTGAGGFIGLRLCERLRAEGREPVGLELSDGAAERIERAGAEFRPLDVTDPELAERALSDCGLVVHAAALVAEWGEMREYARVNVGGTYNVLNAAERARAERVVHVSSVAVWGYGFEREPQEDAPPAQCGNPYIDTKGSSELLALSRGATVVRPGDVYGPGSKQWAIRPLELMKSGLFFVPGKGDGLITPVYVDDLVDCLVRALEAPGVDGQAFTAWDGHPVTAKEFFDHYARMLGKGEVRTLPLPLAYAATLGEELVGRLRRRPPRASRSSIMFLSRRAAFPNARARELLGWEPRVALAEGMRRTEAWFREQGMLAA
jgi:nucleoside-diphosphate-sugar epimerase